MTHPLFELSPQPKKRIVFPGDSIAEDRIRAVLDVATDIEIEKGFNWYQNAHNICVQWLGNYSVLLSLDHAAGILAALSPMQSWQGNIRSAETLLATGNCKGLGYAVTDARQMYEGAHPYQVLYEGGRNNTKVRSFYENIRNPDEVGTVTIDRHMIGLLADDPHILDSQRWISRQHHRWAKERFETVADEINVLPHQAQAIAWITWRRIQGITEAPDTGNQLQLFEEIV